MYVLIRLVADWSKSRLTVIVFIRFLQENQLFPVGLGTSLAYGKLNIHFDLCEIVYQLWLLRKERRCYDKLMCRRVLITHTHLKWLIIKWNAQQRQPLRNVFTMPPAGDHSRDSVNGTSLRNFAEVWFQKSRKLFNQGSLQYKKKNKFFKISLVFFFFFWKSVPI